MGDSQTKRVVIEFPGENYDRLMKLKDQADATSLADVVRRALKLFEFFMQSRDEGWTIQLKRGDESKDVEILL